MKHGSMPLVVLLLVVPSVGAGELYRCVGPSRQVSYQSVTCPHGHRTDRTIEFAADAPTASKLPPRKDFRSVRSRVTYAARHVNPEARTDRCSRAKAHREQTLESLGLSRTYDQLSRIDATVRSACKGY